MVCHYIKLMNAHILSTYPNQKTSSDLLRSSRLQDFLEMIENTISLILLFFASIFFIWADQKHKEYKVLEIISNQ
jgi:hypothetical protein